MKNWLLILLQVCLYSISFAQHYVNDSCMGIRFVTIDNSKKLRTELILNGKGDSISKLLHNFENPLNLYIEFINNCDKSIRIPSELHLDQPEQSNLTIYCQELVGHDTIDLDMNVEYDYLRHKKFHPNFLPKNKIQIQEFKFPLDFDITKGQYRLRLCYTDYKLYYYSNWFYLKIE